VVFGRDGTGKPHAWWFDTRSADLTTKAADPMKVSVARIETGKQKAIAPHLAR